MIKYILILMLCFGIIGCKTTGKHWLVNKETGNLELVEQIETTGTGKHDVKFETGGEAKSDSGWKVPEVNLPKMEFE
ncbi:MAG TPA: hypothetical protein ENI13_01415 [candidate division CPR3 bacterium]|uniref:Lipoprotein n=1 Tax=candidate division CPR3 bacterium TaxID=2268181 RepID=A0A7C1T5N8_UNCC3|nr:hypothetical protein [candidate division CPR3 bacterium]